MAMAVDYFYEILHTKLKSCRVRKIQNRFPLLPRNRTLHSSLSLAAGRVYRTNCFVSEGRKYVVRLTRR